jgi:Uncharacterized conserved protein
MKNLKKILFMLTVCLLSVSLFTACSDDDDPTPVIPPVVEPSNTMAYVLNSGRMDFNNAGLSLLNVTESSIASADIFSERNSRGLGDTGQDMVVYGSKIYVAVYGSGVIEVTDITGESIKQITSDEGMKPRGMVAHGGKVYVTLYEGYLARLDTASLVIEDKVKVGRNPEQVVVANNKLYVANSGGLDYNTPIGYDNTVSVVDINSFEELKKIEVVINPCNMVTDNQGDVYVVSMGNYGDVPNTLQKINSYTDEVSTVEVANATEMASTGDIIYMIYSQYDADQVITFYAYNAINETVITDSFTDTSVVSNPYKISADEETGRVYITASDYRTNGDVYEFDANGSLLQTYELGMNPVKVVVIR